MARRRNQGHGRSSPLRGAPHARLLAATLAVAQRGQQNPQWVVCMFSRADSHIAVCDPKRLPRPEAVIRVTDCARVIVKALLEGEHHCNGHACPGSDRESCSLGCVARVQKMWYFVVRKCQIAGLYDSAEMS